jgi:SPP1 gp7 family putative phage head morphogenesis protein
MRQSQKKKRSVVPAKWLFPNSQEREYQRDLKSLTTELRRKIKEVLLPEIPGMIREVQGHISIDRSDDFIGRLKGLILFIESSMLPKVESTIREAEQVGREINYFNKRQFDKLNEQVFGIDLFVNEPFLSDQLKIFSAENSQLIKSLPTQELERVSGIIERGLQQGESYSTVAKEIQKSFGITDRRSKLIARDQTQKLNNSLTKLRQQEIGVEEYIWETSGDERVRPSHKANNGKKFRWDKPPAKTGHPGHDVNCRCIARPVLDKILDLG